mmetsp:Transcript_1606/g.1421  ORF Transcript_1606/g.1421 Transcript_1606/m.1421 type:complete len:336 (+) Transcript_1606:370-1377(+)
MNEYIMKTSDEMDTKVKEVFKAFIEQDEFSKKINKDTHFNEHNVDNLTAHLLNFEQEYSNKDNFIRSIPQFPNEEQKYQQEDISNIENLGKKLIDRLQNKNEDEEIEQDCIEEVAEAIIDIKIRIKMMLKDFICTHCKCKHKYIKYPKEFDDYLNLCTEIARVFFQKLNTLGQNFRRYDSKIKESIISLKETMEPTIINYKNFIRKINEFEDKFVEDYENTKEEIKKMNKLSDGVSKEINEADNELNWRRWSMNIEFPDLSKRIISLEEIRRETKLDLKQQNKEVDKLENLEILKKEIKDKLKALENVHENSKNQYLDKKEIAIKLIKKKINYRE